MKNKSDFARNTAGAHLSALQRLDLPPGALGRLESYLDLLEQWNRRVNLTGARTAHDRVEILIERALPALPFILPGRAIDIGSGNGSPGIVIAMIRNTSHFTLLEPRLRRWAFLREVVRSLKIDNVDVRRDRYEDFAGPPATTVTIRGLAFAPGAIDPLLARGGRLLCFGGRHDPGAGYEPLAMGSDLSVWARCST
ncbi:MAG: class I SAM-dependent methyltransferase [Vicinamibacteria bacterium]|nr:class I SAM-dependent methyltransferase [Vicinamibacteria bacterium]